MFLILTSRVKRMLWNATRFERISVVFKETSSIISKLQCIVVDLHENQNFFENKTLFFNKRYMFLTLTCRDTNAIEWDQFEANVSSFPESSSIISKISCSVGEMQENRSLFVGKGLFFNDIYMFLNCLVELNKCYRMRIV